MVQLYGQRVNDVNNVADDPQLVFERMTVHVLDRISRLRYNSFLRIVIQQS